MDYQCSCCGSISKKRNFYKSYSKLNRYRGIQNVCKDCIVEIYKDFVNKYKSEDRALYNLCMLLDVYYDEKVVISCKEKAKESGKELPLEYMPKLGLKQYANKSFIDSEEIDFKVKDNEKEEKKEEKTNAKSKKSIITPEMIQRWGENLEENDYLFLEERFKMMCDTYDNKNIANIWQYQEIALNYLQIQKLRKEDDEKSTATAIKLMDSTSKMMNDCKMKSTQLDGSDDLDANLPGIWAKRIQEKEPVPEAQGIFADPDRIQVLFDNQFVKPMRKVLGVGDRNSN